MSFDYTHIYFFQQLFYNFFSKVHVNCVYIYVNTVATFTNTSIFKSGLVYKLLCYSQQCNCFHTSSSSTACVTIHITYTARGLLLKLNNHCLFIYWRFLDREGARSLTTALYTFIDRVFYFEGSLNSLLCFFSILLKKNNV